MGDLMATVQVDYDEALTLSGLVRIELQTAERLGGKATQADYAKDLKALLVKLDNACIAARDEGRYA